MKLNLNKPFAVIDLETTGVNVGFDRIVEVSIVKISQDHKKEVYTRRVNPGIPISPESVSIHGITDEDVKDEPMFSKIAQQVSRFIGNADLGGYNAIRFDIPLLMEEFLRADVEFSLRGRKIVDIQNIFHKMEPRNLTAAYKFYCNKKLEEAHSAEADALATLEILENQLDHYKDAPYENTDGDVSFPIKNDIDMLADFSTQSRHADLAGHLIYNEEDKEIFNFGKYKGRAVEEVFKTEPQYYDWMMKSKFPLYTKKVITAIYLRKFGNESINLK